MQRIGLNSRIVIVNDALIALETARRGSRAVIISGTGSIAYGRNAAGEAARSGGWGYVLGDEGSGYWIGRGAARGASCRGSLRAGTVLTQMLLDHFQVSQPQLLLHEVYHHHLKPAAIGALASCVQTAFSEGDEAAVGILRGAADELEGAALSVARRLDLTGEAFTFILSGGIFRAVPWLVQELHRRLPLAAPHSVTKLLDREPAEGAVTLALQEAHGGARIPVYKH